LLHILEALLHARVLAEVVDEVGRFGNVLLNVLRMPLAILHTENMIIAAAGEVVVERDHLVTLLREARAEIRADEARTARNEYEFLLCHKRRLV
jgi:hypothetical protein